MRRLPIFLLVLAACESSAPPAAPVATAAPAAEAADAAVDSPGVPAVPAPPPAPEEAAAPESAGTLQQARDALRRGDDARAKEILEALAASLEDSDDRDVANYLLARLLVPTEPARAAKLLRGLPTPFDDAEARRLVWQARAEFAAGLGEAGIATVDKIPAAPERDALRIKRAEALHAAGRVDEAVAGLDGLGEPRLRATALGLISRWLAGSNKGASEAAARTLFIEYPAEPAAQDPALPVGLDDLSAKERFRRASELMDAWEYAKAREEFRALGGSRAYAGRARWNIAIISLRKLRDDPAEAEKILAQILRLKRHGKREEALYLMMRAQLVQERYDRVLAYADQYDQEYPRGEYAERTSYYRGWLHYDRGDCKKALPGFKAYLKKKQAKRSLVLGFRAWCYVRMGRWKWAYRSFGGLIPGGPLTEGKARYWRAVSLGELGRQADGRKELQLLRGKFPLTYYDMLGRQLEARWDGRDERASAQPWPEAPPPRPLPTDAAWDWPQLPKDDLRSFQRVRRLVELDEIDAARAAYAPMRGSVEARVAPDKRADFTRFMGTRVQDFRHGWRVSTGRISNQEGLPDPSSADAYLAYPEAYAPLVERLAGEFGLSPHYIYAIMRQESRYNPAAVSWADAVGALQMIRPTARKVAGDLGVTFDPETFAQPKISFRYSAHYLAKHAQLFHGQLVPSAAAYNGGPEPVARWVRKSGGLGLARLIEEFEYNESRIYCRQVASHMLRYLYLYERDPAVRGKYLDALFPVRINAELPEGVGY